jgi:hypothetical protein
MGKNSAYQNRFDQNASMPQFGMKPVDVGQMGYGRNPYQQSMWDQGQYARAGLGPTPPSPRTGVPSGRTGDSPGSPLPPGSGLGGIMGNIAGAIGGGAGNTVPAPPRAIQAPAVQPLAQAAGIGGLAGQVPNPGYQAQPMPALPPLAQGGSDYSIGLPPQAPPGFIQGVAGQSTPITQAGAGQLSPNLAQSQALIAALRGSGL